MSISTLAQKNVTSLSFFPPPPPPPSLSLSLSLS